ncbi:MAG: phage tail protein [Anaerolineae bacterium]|nr:phage tail protein [Anaerolineae bacterium]MCA9895444.1 phage tail protein [Anaerolineae bacterium]
MPRRQEDPVGQFNFIVEIDGLEAGAFTNVDGLSSETEVVLFRSGNDRSTSLRKLPGLVTYGNVTLKRGYIGNHDLYQWRQQIINGMVDRRSVVITLLNEAREPVSRFVLIDAWPSKWQLSSLDGKGNDIVIEELVLAVERIELNN